MVDILVRARRKALLERFLSAVGDGDLDANGRWVTSTETFDEWFTAIKARPTCARFEEPVSLTVRVEDGQLAFVRGDATIVVDGQVRSTTSAISR